jgi:hypothetical protein
MWRGTPYQPIRLDARADLNVDVVGDWNELANLFPPASFDVVVWDPPHLTDAGRGIVGAAQWGDRYGTRSVGLRAVNISHLFTPFLRAASAVLVPKAGIVLAKIADQVHSGAQQLQFVDFVNAARAEGFTVCDYSVKVRDAGIEDPKWTHRFHVRKPWSFWVVVRAGCCCKGPGASLLRVCQMCNLPFRTTRKDALTCSPRCRQRRRRALAA